jgi:hypothetical protein
VLLFFQRSCDIISNLNDVLIFSFSWRYWFGYHTRIEQSIAMHSVKHFKIFLWRGQTITLSTTTESPFVWSKICRTSSVVGAPSGRHSRLDPAITALHLLNDQALLPPSHPQDTRKKKPCSVKVLSPQDIQNSVEWSYGSSWWLPRRESRIIFKR